jgi:hypothetical protein
MYDYKSPQKKQGITEIVEENSDDESSSSSSSASEK